MVEVDGTVRGQPSKQGMKNSREDPPSILRIRKRPRIGKSWGPPKCHALCTLVQLKLTLLTERTPPSRLKSKVVQNRRKRWTPRMNVVTWDWIWNFDSHTCGSNGDGLDGVGCFWMSKSIGVVQGRKQHSQELSTRAFGDTI